MKDRDLKLVEVAQILLDMVKDEARKAANKAVAGYIYHYQEKMAMRDAEKWIEEKRAEYAKKMCPKINKKCETTDCTAWGEEINHDDGHYDVRVAVWCHQQMALKEVHNINTYEYEPLAKEEKS